MSGGNSSPEVFFVQDPFEQPFDLFFEEESVNQLFPEKPAFYGNLPALSMRNSSPKPQKQETQVKIQEYLAEDALMPQEEEIKKSPKKTRKSRVSRRSTRRFRARKKVTVRQMDSANLEEDEYDFEEDNSSRNGGKTKRIGKSSKSHKGVGLKTLANRAYRILIRNEKLPYNQISSVLNDELRHEKIIVDKHNVKEEKNRRRRIYDAINVGISMEVLNRKKHQRKFYVGRGNSSDRVNFTDVEKEELQLTIQELENELKEKEKKIRELGLE